MFYKDLLNKSEDSNKRKQINTRKMKKKKWLWVEKNEQYFISFMKVLPPNFCNSAWTLPWHLHVSYVGWYKILFSTFPQGTQSNTDYKHGWYGKSLFIPEFSFWCMFNSFLTRLCQLLLYLWNGFQFKDTLNNYLLLLLFVTMTLEFVLM